MGLILLIIFVGVPLIELSLLIEIGSDIGAISTIALCLLTAGIGLSLIRMQGLKVMADMQAASAAGTPLVESLIHGFFLLIAGALLFFPGFMTDAIGGLLLIPPFRLLLGRIGVASAFAKRGAHFSFHHSANQHGDNRRPSPSDHDVTIDGEFWRSESEASSPLIEGTADSQPKPQEDENSDSKNT